jgi:RNA polymerase sigma-70 factor (ECF subfamily)
MPPEAGNLDQRSGRSPQDDQTAIDRSIPVAYQELRRLAARYLRSQSSSHTLTPTALVHEAYLRLVARTQSDWQDRTHFFYLAATVMRQVLVDHARAKIAAKRGGGRVRVTFDEAWNHSDQRARDLVALDDALKALAAYDERKARIIELRYFGGMSVEEAAGALEVSTATIGRETRHAEAWLRRELQANQWGERIA